MGSFCNRCGKPLAAGEVCSCSGGASRFFAAPSDNYRAAPSGGHSMPPTGGYRAAPSGGYSTPPAGGYSPAPSGGYPTPPAGGYRTPPAGGYRPAPTGGYRPAPSGKSFIASVKTFWESMKNRMGIGDPELNKGNAFEKGKLIIPDCVSANEGEIPVRQYRVATLRNRILGIPYTRAVGRMQVTNKRVIFRAPGKCLAGKTTLQHEFAIDEIAGVEARREYVFNFWDFIFGSIVASFGGAVSSALILSILENGGLTGAGILAFLFGIAGCVPFFMIKKKWLLKLLCLGCSFMPLITVGGGLSHESEFFGGLFTFLGAISFILALFTMFIYSIKPNLVLLIKTKSASEAIDIKRKKPAIPFFGGGGGKEDEHTGYTEVIPAEDAERCIREIDAMINDIQKLGDFGIEKWKG